MLELGVRRAIGFTELAGREVAKLGTIGAQHGGTVIECLRHGAGTPQANT